MSEASCQGPSKKPMSRLVKLLAASVLVVAAIVSAAPKAAAQVQWCNTCAANPSDCYACCKCDGGTTYYCSHLCFP